LGEPDGVTAQMHERSHGRLDGIAMGPVNCTRHVPVT